MTTADFDWPAHLESAFDAAYYCALSTSGSDGPWVNPVYFARDRDNSILFISLDDSRHMRNIASDPRVAVAIFSTDQPPGRHVRGLQMAGTARRLPDNEVPDACRAYFARPGAAVAIGESNPDPADYTGDDPGTWKFVRITPAELCYFDSEHFGERRVPVPREVWDL